MRPPNTACIVVDLAGGGHARATRLTASDYLAPRLVDVTGNRVRVALVAVCATLLAGDDVRIDVTVGAGVSLELLEPSGTVAYDAQGVRTTWQADVSVGEQATLIWQAAPFVVADGADVHRRTRLDLTTGATALIRELLVVGRTGEVGGRVRAATYACHDRRPLLIEDIDLRDRAHRSAPGIVGSNRVVATTALLGIRPEETVAPHESRLAGRGALARYLAPEAHIAEDALADTWRRWRDLLPVTDTARSAIP